MVLSASGWRAVFGDDDHSLSPAITTAHRDLIAVAANVFLEAVRDRRKRSGSTHDTTIVVATDTRPTGPAIADTAMRVFLAKGVRVVWLGVAAAPEVMAYTRAGTHLHGFFYVSASHNPPGHNGLKLGFSDGAVLPADTALPLIETFKRRAADQHHVASIVSALAAVDPDTLDTVERSRDAAKRDALEAYRTFALTCGIGPMDAETFRIDLATALNDRPLGIVAEMNGSARSRSIDGPYLASLGARVAVYNDEPGTFAHQILPEGAGLDHAVELLRRHAASDSAFRVAYVPDNDGDRGNLVFADDDGTVGALDAQSVFALVVTTELAWLKHLERRGHPFPADPVVVVNGPTSSRIEAIVAAFGARVIRTEVGEANVVQRARTAEAEGAHIVLIGEGSNGGNITPPSTVRDPISTIQALVKLHAFHLDRLWPGMEAADDTAERSFPDVVASLPAFTTLPTDDPRAKMNIGELTHARLKAAYESLLSAHLPEIIHRLADEYGREITWRVVNYEGTTERPGVGNRTGNETGGLRVVFSSATPTPAGVETFETTDDVAALWMRGSGTEPVFRILADCRGDRPELLDFLVERQRRLVLAAVADAGGNGGDGSDGTSGE